ncbi:PAQR family membrane homeostasis protein TrhA [Candidatus Formimonas warabiya]|nr:hemolysin III family protein [Candidatus Formimonas warabiya]
MMIRFRDPVSGLTHLFGFLVSIPGLILLVWNAAHFSTPWHIVSFSIFGASLILLYAASSLYHLVPVSDKGVKILRRIDHIMIFVLIAGTYTPVCLIPLRGAWGWSLLGSIWGLAILGIFLKIFWRNCPRWISTIIYIFMGWLVLIAFFPLIKTIPLTGFSWLVIGGFLYTIGAVIYGTKRPRISAKWLGFHEIFHLFVLAGSFSHFWLMLKYLMYLN